MKIKEVPIYTENESYDKFCILLICLLRGKCINTSLFHSKKDTDNLLLENNIDNKKINKCYKDFINAKFGKNNKKMTHVILIENCLESFYRAELIQDIKFENWRYSDWLSEEAYWIYIKILDSLTESGWAIKFAENIVKILWFNKCLEIYNRILKDNNESKYRWYLWGTVINKNGNIYLRNFDKKNINKVKNTLSWLKKEEKLIFSVFYTTYNLRNKYTHTNFPIPSRLFRSEGFILPTTIDEALGVWKKEWNNTQFIYFLDYIKSYNKYTKNKIFINERSFKLLPSIEFLKEITKLILVNKIDI